MMPIQRLDHFIAKTTFSSRKIAKKDILNKKVMVNQKIITQPDYKVTNKDSISFEGKELLHPTLIYLALNKPASYICSHKSEAGYKPIFDLIDLPNAYDLHIAGRLDQDTTGLVLLTNDGQWSHLISHPNQWHEKKYHVTCEKSISKQSILLLEQGLLLQNEKNKTRPAKVEQINEFEIYLKISEGKYHQVKRMISAVGNKVTKLHRCSIGTIELGSLSQGNYRNLTQKEIETIPNFKGYKKDD